MSKLISFFFVVGMLLLAACSSGPLRSINAGDELQTYNFSEDSRFEEGAYADATLRIIDGVYRISMSEGDSEVWWAQWGDSLDDVVIDVDVEQISQANENAYGVACRLSGQVGQPGAMNEDLFAVVDPDAEATAEASAESTAEAEATEEAMEENTADTAAANGDGYLFLIRGNGSFAILRSSERTVTALVNWTPSDLINQGPARNQLRAVCMGDYLALYINGEFAADATDDSYSSGQVGMAASASGRLGAVIEFDNLVISEAEASA